MVEVADKHVNGDTSENHDTLADAHNAYQEAADATTTSATVRDNSEVSTDVQIVKLEDGVRGSESEAARSKKRKFDSISSKSRTVSRGASPPWNFGNAKGPSSFKTDDGRRVSARRHGLPEELQEKEDDDKRRTRAASTTKAPRNRSSMQNGTQAKSLSTPGKLKRPTLTEKTPAQTDFKIPLQKRSHKAKAATEVASKQTSRNGSING
ncbi:hypothetical protein LTS18_002499, partial [Coniosporium uncinatum]